MKQVAVWKTVLFTFLSLGIYALYWVATRRKVLLKEHKDAGPIPHWAWLLIIPVVCGVLLISWLVMCILIVLNLVPISGYDATVYPLGALLYAIPLVVGISWLWFFGRAIEVVTQGRLPRIWSIFLYVFVGPFVIAFYQYYINKLDENKKGASYDVGWGLIGTAAILGIFSVAGLISSVTTYPRQVQEGRDELLSLQAKSEASNRIFVEYTTCVNELAKNFPEGSVTAENKAAYDAASNMCREKYDAYVKSINDF